MAQHPHGDAGFLRRIAHVLGLVHPPAGAPLEGRPRRSRYGPAVWPRLDQDLDDLRARLEALERRAGRR